ncbi:hypothetical protein C1X51_32745, partial [Pseudomonas sp. FW306-2-2C-B10A]|uniref:hypothetical protein n=1 Tax=Pseudomonas sp. FW306-2-2C-B10A TaxID=2070593 RepID=UPI000CB19B7B
EYEAASRRIDLPVPPFRLWGLDFEEEVLFEFGDHPTWGMMEITPVRVRGGELVWFVLASERSGVQHVVVNGPEMVRLAQVFPAPVFD